jgi:hypothetical protein
VTIKWEAIKADSAWDGSLRDIYVRQTDIADWQKLLDSLRQSKYPIVSSFSGGDEIPIPTTIDDSFFDRQDVPRQTIAILVDAIQVNCHFFLKDEIELDIDPRQITNQSDLNSLLEFIQFVGTMTDKTTILTYENMQNAIILEYVPKLGRFVVRPYTGSPL